jgi:invasion protein IalB
MDNGVPVPREALLAAAAAAGLDYGPAFQAVAALAANPAAGVAEAELRRPPTAPPDSASSSTPRGWTARCRG